MNKRTVYKYVLAALVLVSMMAVGILFVAETEAENPSSVIVTLFKTELKASAAGAPVEVFNNAGGSVVDLVQDVSKAFGQGAVEGGTYNMIVFTVENEITFTEDISEGLCNGVAPQTVTMLIDPGLTANAQVPLYFATPSAGGKSGWVANGSADYPFMMLNPVEVVADQTTAVEIMFQTAGTVSCNSGVAELNPPSIAVSYVIVEETEACSPAGTYWFYHYAMRGNIYNSDGVVVNTNSLGEMIQNSEVVSGWGTMMVNTPTLGEGTWGVYVGNVYNATTNPGMAEHRHKLASWSNTPGNTDEGLQNPVVGGSPDALMGGTYKLSGQRMIFYMPEGGFFEGAINQSCEIFAGVNLTGGDNDLIYAVRKGDFSSALGNVIDAFPDATMVMVQPQIEIQYEPSPVSGIVNTSYLYFGTEFAALSTTLDRYMGWRSSNQLSPAWGPGGPDYSSWEAKRPEERAEGQGNVFSMLSISDDGQLIMGADEDTFVAFGGSGTGIIAGSALESDPDWGNHRHTAGIILPVNKTPLMSDLVGTWSLSMLESEVVNTVAWSTPDNARINFYIQYGDITINSVDTPPGVRNGVANFFGINALTGEVLNSPGGEFFIYGPVTECYDDPGLSVLSLYPATCTGTGISVPVFLINGVDESGAEESPGPSVKIALDATKGSIAMWSPADLSGTIESEATDGCYDGANWGADGTATLGQECQLFDGNPTCDSNVVNIADPDYCVLSDPSSRNTFGIGIKIQ